jgi:hypothetical protein
MAPPKSPTPPAGKKSPAHRAAIDDILKARDAATKGIYAQIAALRVRAEEIKDTGYDGGLKPAQVKELGEINAARSALAMAESELALITLRTLDQADEVQRLENVISAVNKDLDKRLRQTKSVAKVLKEVGKVLGIMEKVVQTLAKLAPFI